MNLDIQNIFNTEIITKDQFDNFSEKLLPSLEGIHKRNQGFYKIFDDKTFLDEVERIENFTNEVKGKFTDIVLCGIGGSALGPITIRDSLTPLFNKNKPKLHVLENIDPDMISDITNYLNLEKTLFIVISKSGGTPETLSQYLYFRDILEKNNLKLSDHIVTITGPDGFLRDQTIEHQLTSFSVPENVGGRFSVLTAVGLLPSSLIGIDIRGLLQGGKEIVEQFLSLELEKNLPFQLAAIEFLSKKTNHVLMPYATKLRSFSSWFTQLLAESTGKINAHGESVGYTPICALGATDQHSQIQLFAEGPSDKLVIFISVENFEKNTQIPVSIDHEKTNFLKGQSFKDLLLAEYEGTAQALTEKKCPNCTISIDKISAKNLGKLFVLFQGATAFLGEFLEINAFDQPGVERSKILTREILKKI